MRHAWMLTLLIPVGGQFAVAGETLDDQARSRTAGRPISVSSQSLSLAGRGGAVRKASTHNAHFLLANGVDYLETYGDPERALAYLERASSLKSELSSEEQQTLKAALSRAKQALEGPDPSRSTGILNSKAARLAQEEREYVVFQTPDPLVIPVTADIPVAKRDQAIVRTLVQVHEGEVEPESSIPGPLALPDPPVLVEPPTSVPVAASTPPLNLDQFPVLQLGPQGYDRTPAYVASPYSHYHRDYYLPTRYNPNYDRPASEPPPYPPRHGDWRPSGKLWYGARSAPWYYGYWYYPRHVRVPEETRMIPCPEGVPCSHPYKKCR